MHDDVAIEHASAAESLCKQEQPERVDASTVEDGRVADDVSGAPRVVHPSERAAEAGRSEDEKPVETSLVDEARGSDREGRVADGWSRIETPELLHVEVCRIDG